MLHLTWDSLWTFQRIVIPLSSGSSNSGWRHSRNPIPNNTASHPRRLKSSATQLWEPEILPVSRSYVQHSMLQMFLPVRYLHLRLDTSNCVLTAVSRRFYHAILCSCHVGTALSKSVWIAAVAPRLARTAAVAGGHLLCCRRRADTDQAVSGVPVTWYSMCVSTIYLLCIAGTVINLNCV